MELLVLLKDVLTEAGQLAMEYYAHLEDLKVEHKSPRDLVTEADRKVEDLIRAKLHHLTPQFGFFGEESGISGNKSARWIVDPIDGTHSFLRGQYFWCISIALEQHGEITHGGVFAPALNELFLAAKGQGATRNGKPCRVSHIPELSQAMISTGFACLRAHLENNNLSRFNRVAKQSTGQRRFGSAALDLCLVACGQVDSFFEQELNLYDVAAGALIVEEAGGHVMDFSGKRGLNPKQVLATNGRIDEEIIPLM